MSTNRSFGISNFSPFNHNASIDQQDDFPMDSSYLINPYWLQFPQVPWQAHYFMGSILVIIGIIGGAGNLLVILIFTRFDRRRNPANVLIVNLAISDFITSCLHPMPCYSSFVKHWIFGLLGCQLYAAGTGLFGLMSIATLTAISIERYAVICVLPLRRWALTFKRTLKTIAAIWIYCLALMLPPFFGWGRFTLEGFLTSCSFDYLDQTAHNRSYIIYLFFFGFVTPVCCITFCYSFMLKVIVKHEKEMCSTNSVRRHSSTNKPNKRVDTKTAKIVLVLIILFVVSWSPYAIVTLIAQFSKDPIITPFLSSLPALFAKAANVYNPIVYGISHPIFRKGIKRWFLCEHDVPSSRLTFTRKSSAQISRKYSNVSRSSSSKTPLQSPVEDQASTCYL